MNREEEKVRGIIHELVSYALENGAVSIDIRLSISDEITIIKLGADSLVVSDEKIKSLKTRLQVPRQVEIEEPYWRLVGTGNGDSSLYMVGAMVDKFDLEYAPESGFKVTLYRKK
jgi:hypothetical protein